jgi:hypothetical protein
VAVINPPSYLQNLATHTAQVDRLASVGGLLLPSAAGELRARGGVRMAGDYNVTAAATPNMTVNVAAGIAFVAGQAAVAGTYTVGNDGVVNLAVSAANATLPRNDLVVLRVRDSFYSGTIDSADLFVLAGTAAASPVDPTPSVGASYLILARISVGAGVTSITSGAITMLARPVQAGGSILPVTTTDTTAGLYDGQYRDHPTRGLERWDATNSRWVSPTLQTWVDMLRNTTYSAATTVGSAYASLPSLDVNASGLPPGREIEVEFKATQMIQPSSSTTALRLAINATVQDAIQYATSTNAYYQAVRLSGSSIVPASGVVPIQVQSMTTVGAAATVGVGSGANVTGAVILRYRIR